MPCAWGLFGNEHRAGHAPRRNHMPDARPEISSTREVFLAESGVPPGIIFHSGMKALQGPSIWIENTDACNEKPGTRISVPGDLEIMGDPAPDVVPLAHDWVILSC